MQLMGLRTRGPRQTLRSLLGVDQALTPTRTLVTPLSTGNGNRPAPVLRFADTAEAPTGDFAAAALPNHVLRSDMVPGRGSGWEAVEEFALTYDGYAYWSDVAELGNHWLQSWTRERRLPETVDELRGCLFYEQRRWHHFGEEPSGRGSEYVWALLDAIRTQVTFAPARPSTRAASSAPAPAPVALPAPPVLPAPPSSAMPEPPANGALAGTTAVFADDDDGYRAWLAGNHGGFVVNAPRGSSPKGLKLHRAACSSVAGQPGRSATSSYRKVCASELGAVLDWCLSTFEADPDPCQRCQP